jgi:hypothetical protein
MKKILKENRFVRNEEITANKFPHGNNSLEKEKILTLLEGRKTSEIAEHGRRIVSDTISQ